jgi:PKD repeat protein
MANTVAEMANWDRYPTWDVYVEMMQSYAQDYSDICKLDTIGYSVEGRALLCLVISDNVQIIEAEPNFFWTNTMHGDELVCYTLSLRLADYLLSNYGSDNQVDSLINNIRIFINPLSNPDGTFYGSPLGTSVQDSRRYNANDIDLNRNFPTISQEPTSIEPEIQAMIDYANAHHFVMSVNTHSGAEVLNYPWDEWTSDENAHADDNWWQYVGNLYASQAISNSPSGYFQGVSNTGYIEGAEWYTTSGSRQDYMTYYQNGREITLEWSNDKLLDASELPAHWDYNWQSMLDYTAQVLYGFNGIVSDSITGEPLEAKVFVLNHDKDNSEVFSHLPLGDYYRPIEAGTFSVQFSASGYRTKTIEVTTYNNVAFVLNVELAPLSQLPPTVDFLASQTLLNCSNLVQFTNLSEAASTTVYNWDFGDGTSSSDFEPMHAYSQDGVYTVSLWAENINGEDEMIKFNYITVSLPEFGETILGSYCSESGSVGFYTESGNPVNWYLNVDDIVPSESGSEFSVEFWNESSTCFAEQIFSGNSYSLGLQSNEGSGENNSDVENHYLVFNCDVPLILNSVKVYAEGAGDRTIQLKNNIGEILESVTLNVVDGEQVVNLDFYLPVANNLKLYCIGPSNLWMGQLSGLNSFDYPYSVDGVISITGHDYDWFWQEFRSYPYFYDWQVSEPSCVSQRMSGVPIDTILNPVADYTYLSNGLTFEFTSISQNASTWHWDFSDGVVSDEENPQHTFMSDGDYEVILTSENVCGLDSETKIISVQSSISSVFGNKFSVYPNPVSRTLTIDSKLLSYDLIITDIRGSVFYESKLNKSTINLDIEQWPIGVYLIYISAMDKKDVIKIIKD